MIVFVASSQCSVDCGRGQRSREVACIGPDGKPRAENTCIGSKPVVAEICDMGSCAKTWFHTAWDEQVECYLFPVLNVFCIEF